MSQPKSRRDPFDVTLTADQRDELTRRLVDEIRTGKAARATVMEDNGLIDFCYSLYEQESQKGISRDSHRYGSADLTSPIGTENVDALSARASRNIFRQEPLWIVEGIGEDSAKKEPLVEAYMQFRQETIRLQKTAKRVITASLVEYGSIIEVCEDAERCVKHEVVKASLSRNPDDNSIVLDGKTGKPVAATDPETGEPVKAADDADGFVEVHRVWTDYKRRGAYVRGRSMKDFLFLPSHAVDDREVWGHGHRFWPTMGEITRRRDAGEFDKEAVDLLGGDSQERQQGAENDRANVDVLYTPGYDNAEKELWKVQCWLDATGNGDYCFYTAIVSELHSCILSLKYDWLQRFRTVYVNPFPRPYSVYGYSLIGTKLLTTIEEHTAWRNMNADRGTLKANAPMMRLHGAQYDPTIQPFGAGEFIDVSNMQELKPMEFDDISVQSMQKEAQCVTDAQRVIGMNDIAIGQMSSTKRTLGENQMATQESFTRTDDPISNIEEAFEEVGEIMHAIEVQALKEMDKGMPAPASTTQQIQFGADPSFDGIFTADMISGQYRFKPRGSTDEADPQRREARFANGMQSLLVWSQHNPAVAQRMADPEVGDALVQEAIEIMKPRNRAPFLKKLGPAQPPAGPPAPPDHAIELQQMKDKTSLAVAEITATKGAQIAHAEGLLDLALQAGDHAHEANMAALQPPPGPGTPAFGSAPPQGAAQ